MTSDRYHLTPVEDHQGVYFKREDAFKIGMVNGSKLRAFCHILEDALRTSDIKTVVSASAVVSPQSAIAATVAARFGLRSVTIVGGTTPEKAVRHAPIAVACAEGSHIEAIKVGYNPALQSAARKYVASHEGSWHVPYGLGPGHDADAVSISDFMENSGTASQVQNLPDSTRTLVLPFGSGNTVTAVVYGLLKHGAPRDLQSIRLMTIGPDRWDELKSRFDKVGLRKEFDSLPFDRIHLFPDFATYGATMKEKFDGINFHPTYEGKIIRWMNQNLPHWWVDRDGTTTMWIVGGPLDV